MIIMTLPSSYCNEDWNFQNGGDEWECKCSEGKNQSPINLPRLAQAVPLDNTALFDYNKVTKANAQFVWEENMIKMKGNFGTLTGVDLAEFEAYEIRFHTPAEHKIDGQRMDLEVQIFHRPLTEGDFAKKAVLSILFKKTYGSFNNFFDNIDLVNLPDKYIKEVTVENSIDIDDIFMDQPGVTPDHFSYYYYQGSMSAPPCDEQVSWYVVSEPLPLGSTTIDMFRDTINVKLKRESNRPDVQLLLDANIPTLLGNYRKIQDLNDRNVYYFDRQQQCGWEDIKKVIEPQGHYEKIEQKMFKYFKVNDENPSGIPNAVVVTEQEARGQGVVE